MTDLRSILKSFLKSIGCKPTCIKIVKEIESRFAGSEALEKAIDEYLK